MQHRDALFLAAALALHAVAFAVAARVPAGPARALAMRPGVLDVVDVEVLRMPPLETAPERSVPGGVMREPATAPEPRAESGGRSGAGVAPQPGRAPGAVEVAPGPPASDSYDRPEPSGVPGLDGSPVYALPDVLPRAPGAPPAPTIAPAARPPHPDAAGVVLRDTLRARDKAIGIDLPAAGTVGTVVGQAVREANTPNVSRATFEVRLAPSGRVVSVRVVRASAGAADAWERAARRVAQLLAGRALELVGNFAAGATVTVEVASDVEPPAGGRGGINGTGASFDLSNIGAHDARVVRTSFWVRPGI